MEVVTNTDHLAPTDEIGLETVKKRAVSGVMVLTGRTFILNLVSLLATGLLTVFLAPSEFGIFWIVSAVVNFLAYFSDIGLAAALIQKKEKLDEDDLKTTFTIQTFLVFALLIVVFLASPTLIRIYSLSTAGKFLLYALSFSLVLSSFKTIPSVLMERNLEFGKLVIPQILENLVYNLTAVFLAWKGLGTTSFTIAVLVRGVVGLAAIYFLKPWLPGISLSKKSLKKLLTFGLPYQVNTLLATLKDDGLTAVLGGILGPTGLGFLGWAQKWGQAPLRFFMDNVIKVTFPAFARMQNEPEHLKRSVSRSIFFVCILVFPTLIGLLAIAPLLVRLIPKYEKWTPALIPLGLIAVNTVFAAVTTPLTNLLNAIGKIKITFKLMIMWTALTWLFIPALAMKFGVNGAAFGYGLVGASSIVAILVAKKYVNFSLLESCGKPLVAACMMGGVLLILRSFLPQSTSSLIFLIMTGLATYVVSILSLVGYSLIEDVKNGVSAFRKSS